MNAVGEVGVFAEAGVVGACAAVDLGHHAVDTELL